jgi:hypothetical protein
MQIRDEGGVFGYASQGSLCLYLQVAQLPANLLGGSAIGVEQVIACEGAGELDGFAHLLQVAGMLPEHSAGCLVCS